MIEVTDHAAAKIKTLLEGEGTPDYGLRVGVMGGGCSGFQYKLAFEEGAKEMDHVLETKGVRVFVDMKSSLYLNGVVLDYADGLMGAGFKIENPNARTTCGCGESFSA
ncbi:MAG: iron-sulfur cluster insertion protein ErpA [Candidatus Latescibacteria bacterium]|nr:iron-sulfur cluster insertion protein ErpA [Candidatus Latescibacterota bacterium]